MAKNSHNHAADLVRSAKVRASILGLLKSSHDEALSRKQIEDKLDPKFDEFGYNTHNLGLLLRRMADNAQILSEGEGKLRKYRNVNWRPAPETNTPEKLPLKVEKSVVPLPDGIKIDLIKATGRVRITIGGIKIDIGVE